ncbi:hypothetical protein ACX27_07865 [Nostoc piscinale CENA21]|uniref:Uncharacterized protein n=1 Tax=Nostoc piscinale CENA21 TaxID=224013 RepID=A0A0M4TTU9_9NOSO|nr:hypothetical protein [Nostoc piscinale]ALF52794.1 hypothetical protein ACX27_07865 [Nostoc piscinale CENA21]
MKSFPYYYSEFVCNSNVPFENIVSWNCNHRGDIATAKILEVGDILLIPGDTKQLRVVKVIHYAQVLNNTPLSDEDQIIGEVFVEFIYSDSEANA